MKVSTYDGPPVKRGRKETDETKELKALIVSAAVQGAPLEVSEIDIPTRNRYITRLRKYASEMKYSLSVGVNAAGNLVVSASLKPVPKTETAETSPVVPEPTPAVVEPVAAKPAPRKRAPKKATPAA